MTENEAINELQANIDLPFGFTVSDEASKVAIQALEKQIPKKAMHKPTDCRCLYHKMVCPNCEEEVPYLLRPRYCYCGQKLDWS